jgi:hypothetical protein
VAGRRRRRRGRAREEEEGEEEEEEDEKEKRRRIKVGQNGKACNKHAEPKSAEEAQSLDQSLSRPGAPQHKIPKTESKCHTHAFPAVSKKLERTLGTEKRSHA